MKAYDRAEKKRTVKYNERTAGRYGRRILSLLLCLCMVLPMLPGFGGTLPLDTYAAERGAPTSGVTRQADPSTMDGYREMLDFSENTRRAGRLWSDKSVFAYGYADSSETRADLWDKVLNQLTLNGRLDGLDAEQKVQLTDDFLHVYSVLGSSLEITGVPPVRTVIVFDNSASMYNSNTTGATTKNGAETYAENGEELWKLQRIGITIEAINRAIDILMEASAYNEVAVVLFGDGANAGVEATAENSTFPYVGNSTAVTILPMKHYEPKKTAGEKGNEYTPYLTGGWKTTKDGNVVGFNGAHPHQEGSTPSATEQEKGITGKAYTSGWVFVNNEVCGLKQGAGTDAWSKTGYNGCGNNNYTAYSNGTTNIQAGYYVGMQELLNATKKVTVGSESYNCVPSLVVLTDGAATDMLAGTFITPEMEGLYPESRGFVNDTGNKLRSFVGYDYDKDKKEKEIQNFWDMFVEKVPSSGGKYFYESVVKAGQYGPSAVNGNSIPTGAGRDAMIGVARRYSDSVASMLLGTLMTTAYYKAAVKKAYGLTESENWDIYSLSVDILNMGDVKAGAADEAKADGGNTEPKTELPKSWAYNITSNAPTMDPSDYFYKGGKLDLSWLQEKGYIDKDEGAFSLEKAIADPTLLEGHTAYPDYSVGEMVVQGIVKAGYYLNQWAEGKTVETDYQSWSEVKGILGKTYTDSEGNGWNEANYTNPYGHGNGYLLRENQKISWPSSPADMGSISKNDVIANIAYNSVSYYASTSSGATRTLTDAFQEIVDAITEPLFAPVGGVNDLGVGDAVTYMDPIGKYMDVKDVKGLVLFGQYYEIVKTAVYDYGWNHTYTVKQHENEPEHQNDPIQQGWYRGEADEDPESVEGDKLPSGCTSAQDAWDQGWVYRIGYDYASQFVPTLKIINDDGGDELTQKEIAKLRETEFTFYRIDAEEEIRQALHMNPAYLEEGQTEDDALRGKSYSPDGTHQDTPGVYALSDLRIWVEDSGDYNDTSIEHTLSDANFDEALWINIPVNMLPLRTVSINLGDTGASTESWKYTSNLNESDRRYKASFPLRVLYSVGVSDDVLENGRIDIAGAIKPEYILQNKASSAVAAAARGVEQGTLEFFSNWYNPLNRYSDYATTETDYTFGDPVTSFSPSAKNRYYSFEKALPLYSTAYVYDLEGKQWRRVRIQEDPNEEQLEDVRVFSATDFGGRLIVKNGLDAEMPTGGGNVEENTKAINAALERKGISVGDLKNQDMVLINRDLLTDVTKPKDGSGTDPFASEAYYFLPIDYYELHGDGTASWTQYAIARKGSEFGSAYRAAGITNGDMLCWHDVSGKNPQDYPYLSYTETSLEGTREGDYSRGRDYIGTPLGSDGYYEGYNREEHAFPTEKTNPTGEGKPYGDGVWVVCAKPGGLRVGDLAQNVQDKGGDYSTGEQQAQIKAYIEERYPGDPAASGLSWGYYKNNATRTANNYYVPTVGTTSNIAASDIKVNVYLGNNGRLCFLDTTLLITKTVEMPTGMKAAESVQNEDFNFQLFINGIAGKLSAVVVHWNEASRSWQRQFHYIDLELDSQRFLQSADGTKAMVDIEGCRLIANPDTSSESASAYVYAENCSNAAGTVKHKAGDPYSPDAPDAPVYYVYIGKNKNAADIRVADTGFRVYHNEEVDVTESVDGEDVYIDGTAGKQGTFYARKVWLVSVSTYENWAEQNPVSDETFDIEAEEPDTGRKLLYDKAIENLRLLSIDPNVSDTTEIRLETPYLTASTYWTKELSFGVNSNEKDGGPGAVTEALTEDDLYDKAIPGTDSFKGLDNAAIAKNTAEFTLKDGEALLLGGIPAASVYRVTEMLTPEQKEAGYTLKELRHTVQDGTNSRTETYIDRYSTFGDTGTFEESANFINTLEPELLVLSKQIVDESGSVVNNPPGTDFEFTVTLNQTAAAMEDEDGTLYYWQGSKDLTSGGVTWTDDAGKTHGMPESAPEADRYTDYLFPGSDTAAKGGLYLKPLILEDGSYKIKFKANEAVVIYGLAAKMEYSVTETKSDKYPAVGGPDHTTPSGEGTDFYTQTGTILHNSLNYAENKTQNREDFYNQMSTGSLTVAKRITDADADEVDKTFTFTVTLTPPAGVADFKTRIIAEKYEKDGTKVEPFTLTWNPAEDGKNSLTAEFTLQHGERVFLDNLPLGTAYTVKETGRDGYNLEHVADNPDDRYTEGEKGYLPIEDNGVSGSVTRENSQVYLLFNNAKPPLLPLTGGTGVGRFYAIGTLLLIAAVAGFAVLDKKKYGLRTR